MLPHQISEFGTHPFSRPRIILHEVSDGAVTTLRRLSEYVDFVDLDGEVEAQLREPKDARNHYDGAIVPAGPRVLDALSASRVQGIEPSNLETYLSCSHFLTTVFANAETRQILPAPSLRSLVCLRGRYEHMLLATSPEALGRLDELLADGCLNAQKTADWLRIFRNAVQERPAPLRARKVLWDMLTRFDDVVPDVEMGAYLRLLDVVHQSPAAMAVAKATMTSWSIRHEYGFLANQAFLRPFPHDLVLLWSSEESWFDPSRRRRRSHQLLAN